MAGNIVLTDRGLDFVLSANDGGPLIAITHFVPVYDYRIDPNIRPDDIGPLSAISAVADETQSTSISSPFGEIIWRTTGHTLSNNTSIILSGGYDLTAHPESNVVAVNLYNGFPLSDSVSGTSYTVLANGNGTWTWNFTGQTDIVGVNDYSNVMFNVVDYYPVYSNSDTNQLRGAWKCLIDTNIGRAKFNKIALYAQRYNGGSPTGDLEFFAEAYLEEPIIKSGLSQNGFDNIILDLQIDLHSISSTFENVFYSSSADYWSQSPGGLYYPNRIGVGHFQGSTYAISATMDLRKARDVNGNVDTSVPLIRLQYDDNSFNSIDQSPQSDAWRLTGGRKGGDIVIKVADWETYNGSVIAIRPYYCQTIALGTSAKPFREIWLTNISDPWRTPSINILNSVSAGIKIMDSETNYQVIIGNKANDSGNRWGMKIRDLAIEIEGIGLNNSEDRSGALNLYGAYKGGDLWREGQNLLVYNAFCSDGSSDYDVQNIYLFAGLDLSANYTSIDGQVGATHKNIVYAIEQAEINLFCGQNNNLSPTAELHLAAKGKIALHGPIVIQNLSEYADTTALANAILISREYEKRMLIAAGINDDVSFNTLTDRMASIEPFEELYDDNSKLFLIARDVFVDGDISPLQDGKWDLGYYNRFGTLYAIEANFRLPDEIINGIANESISTSTKNVYINGAHFKSVSTRQSSSLVNENTYLFQKDSEVTSDGITYYHNLYIGAVNNRIGAGAFNRLYATTLSATTITTDNLKIGDDYIGGEWIDARGIIEIRGRTDWRIDRGTTATVTYDPVRFEAKYTKIGKTITLHVHFEITAFSLSNIKSIQIVLANNTTNNTLIGKFVNEQVFGTTNIPIVRTIWADVMPTPVIFGADPVVGAFVLYNNQYIIHMNNLPTNNTFNIGNVIDFTFTYETI